MTRLSRYSIHLLTSIVVILVLMTQGVADEQKVKTTQKKDRWAPFRPLIGKWKGTGVGPTGESVQTVEWKLVLNGKFLQSKSTSRARGDNHQDIGIISYDHSRKKYIYRAFHSEGFVNQYVADISPDGLKIVFESEAIENGPKGFKAMEIFEMKEGRPINCQPIRLIPPY